MTGMSREELDRLLDLRPLTGRGIAEDPEKKK
jgi:hypothetical protein